MQLVLFDPLIEPYQVLPRRANEEVLSIPPNSNITETAQSNCLVSYKGHRLEESYPSTKVQSVYSTAQSDWAGAGEYTDCPSVEG